jgi:hypothetical protein
VEVLDEISLVGKIILEWMSGKRDPNSGRNQNIRIDNESFENVEKFKYLTTLTNQNDIHDEIKIRINSGNACYHSVQET